MALGNASRVVSNIPKREVCGVWTGGGAAADCTHTSTDWSRGISAVAYNAATGKYRITLTEAGQQLLPGSHIEICRADGASPLLANIVRSTLDSDSVDFEVWDVDSASALTDLDTTDKVLINLVFATASFG